MEREAHENTTMVFTRTALDLSYLWYNCSRLCATATQDRRAVYLLFLCYLARKDAAAGQDRDFNARENITLQVLRESVAG